MNIIQRIREIKQRRSLKKHTAFEFIDWLRFANPGMLELGNLYCYEYAIKNLPSNNPIVEIGSFCGLSTNLITFYLQHFSQTNKVITCDKWIFEGSEDQDALLSGSTLRHRDYRQFVKETYMRNISFFSKHNLPYTIECFSDDFFDLWEKKEKRKDIFEREIELGGAISFAYIDGNHSYEFAKHDFLNTDKWLEKGGFILFDDSSDFSNWEVKKVISEIKQSGRYEVVVANPNYLVRKIN
ncbi:MAG TPA: class I SAM-dependent methyltransferase [Chitinophagaceae bacterium]|nr:class I SAM-dependent methyltransferase [Chitinophagaceae bacterium]